MRIAVVGAGAIGSAVGALLARAGQDVTLIGRGEHVAAVRRDGLRVDGQLWSFSIRVAADTRIESRPDLALLTVKVQDMAAALAEHREALAGVPVVAMQNGVRGDAIARGALPESPIVGCVVLMTANYLDPGRVTIVQRGHLVVGDPDGPPTPGVEEAARVLGTAVPTSVTDRLPGARWTKTLMNLNNALPALVNESVVDIAEDPYLSRLALGLMREGTRTVQRAGIRLEDLPGLRARQIRLMVALPAAVAAGVYARRARDIAQGGPVLGSTLQSLRRGRATEVDYLNGEVVRIGGQVGMPTPLNARVVELVHRVEASRAFLTSEGVRRAMASPG